MKFHIDPEFAALMPALSADEYRLLEASLKAEGCRDALVVWDDGKGGVLLDGHNRHTICNRLGIKWQETVLRFDSREMAKKWIVRNQLSRRNLTRDQWDYFLGATYNAEKKAVPNPTGVQVRGQNDPQPKTADSLASEYGVSAATVKRAGKTAEMLDARPEKREAVMKRETRARVVREEIKREERKAERKEAAKAVGKTDERILVGDFRKRAKDIPDSSLSLIFTDPPYDRKASSMLQDLATFASAKLARGGSLLCYVGGTQLPEALDALRTSLRYWWTIACVHSGRKTVMREYGINAGWKAVLWFVKETRDDKMEMVSDTMSGGEEKTEHEWQQAQSEAEYWIGKLCPEDGIVCDPFLGSGTTAAAAAAKGRRWIGIEIDEDTAKVAARRLK